MYRGYQCIRRRGKFWSISIKANNIKKIILPESQTENQFVMIQNDFHVNDQFEKFLKIDDPSTQDTQE